MRLLVFLNKFQKYDTFVPHVASPQDDDVPFVPDAQTPPQIPQITETQVPLKTSNSTPL